MTTPIPEAAVEEAARALRDIASQVDETSDDLPEDYISEACVIAGKVTCIHGSPELLARAALTAARPLMEAEALSAWADYFDHYDDGPGRDPLTASKAAQLLRRPRPFGIAAATITERTQR